MLLSGTIVLLTVWYIFIGVSEERLAYSFILKTNVKIEASRSFETSVNFFKTARQIPEVSNLHRYAVRASNISCT
jgi:hypothetical protein